MIIDNSNKRYSIIIMGILIICVLSIFMAYIIGLGEHSLNLENGFQLQNAGIALLNEKQSSSEESNDVYIAQNCTFDGFDTEVGDIIIYDYNIDDPIPLCLDGEEVADWYAVIGTYGGYEPIFGNIEVWQKGSRVWNDCYEGPGTMYLGWDLKAELIDDPEGFVDDCCCWEFYNITIEDNCGNWGCLDSNQYPIIEGDCDICAPFNTIPDKDVTFKVWLTFQGCDRVDQQFEIMYVHKNCSP